MYRKVPQCRICRSQYTAQIDQDLTQRLTYQQIIDKYSAKFPEEKPLTKDVVKSHWKHFRDAVEVSAIERIRPQAIALAETYPVQPVEAQQVFEAVVRERVNEIEVLEQLVVSGLEDLKKLQRKATDDEEGWDVATRDRVRRSTASIVLDSAKVKQMALQADEDRHRLEKGRVVFRMFQLFARSLETCPIEYRTMVAAQLKSAIRDDDEINALLKEQSTAPAVPPKTDE